MPILALRRFVALLLIFLGLFLWYAAFLVGSEGIWPQVRESGWSLSASSMILNRVWQENELYLLFALYAVAGLGTLAGGVLTWRRDPRGRSRRRAT